MDRPFYPSLVAYIPHPLVASAVRQIVCARDEVHLLGIASTTPEMLQVVASEQPSVLLLTFSRQSDLDLIPKIRRESPSGAIVLWAHQLPASSEQEARALGVQGILWRGPCQETMLACIRRVHSGESWFEPAPTARALAGCLPKLTERESDLLTLVAQGLTNKEIASYLSVSKAALKGHLRRLFAKTGARDRFELALYGLRSLTSRSDSSTR